MTHKHSRLAPSGSHRWLVCPGSLQHDAGEGSEYADDGEHRHIVLNKLLRDEPVLAGDRIGDREITVQHISQGCAIRMWANAHRQRLGASAILLEEPVEIGRYAWDMEPGICEGHLDLAIYSARELIVVDAKFGFVQVYPKDNSQLYLYTIGLLHELSAFDFETIRIVIAQPDYSGDVEFKEYIVTRDELAAFASETLYAAMAAAHGDRRLKATVSACQYCPGKLSCSARMALVENIMYDNWLETHPLHELLQHLPALEAICRDLKREGKKQLLDGKDVPGFKLVAAKSIRKWGADNETVIKAIDEATDHKEDFNADNYYEQKLLSPAKMEKVLGKEVMKKLPVVKPMGAPKVVPISDPRPAITPEAWKKEDIEDLLDENEQEQ